MSLSYTLTVTLPYGTLADVELCQDWLFNFPAWLVFGCGFSAGDSEEGERQKDGCECDKMIRMTNFSYIYVYILNENSTDTPCSHWHTHSIASECAVETAVYSFIHSLESCE